MKKVVINASKKLFFAGFMLLSMTMLFSCKKDKDKDSDFAQIKGNTYTSPSGRSYTFISEKKVYYLDANGKNGTDYTCEINFPYFTLNGKYPSGEFYQIKGEFKGYNMFILTDTNLIFNFKVELNVVYTKDGK